MVSNKFLLTCTIVTATVCVLGGGTAVGASLFRDNRRIVFDAKANKLYDGTADGCPATKGGTASSRGGAEYAFAYKGLANSSDAWQSIKKDGYVANIDRLPGIESLTISSTYLYSGFKIYWDAAPLSFSSGVPSSSHSAVCRGQYLTFDFHGDRPNYFCLIAGGSFDIEKMELTFSGANDRASLNIDYNSDYGSVTGAGIHGIGESFDLVATANEGCRFVGWYAEGELLSEAATYRFTMPECDEHYDIEARFAANQYEVSVVSSDISKGTVSGAGTYDYGAPVTLVAKPAEGYGFRGWYKGGSLVSMDNPYTFPMPAEKLDFIGLFSENDYRVSVTCDSSKGSVIGGGIYQYKQPVTLRAIPKENHAFDGWYDESGVLLSEESNYSFEMPFNDLVIEARFVPTVIYKGSYPQTRVTDSSLTYALNAAAIPFPTQGTETLGKWESYN